MSKHSFAFFKYKRSIKLIQYIRTLNSECHLRKKYMYNLLGFFVDVSILSRAKIEIKIFKWNKIFSVDFCAF